MLTIGSLFAGIGGLELGLEMSGLGHVVWQVEKNADCRAVLAHHWPHVERFEDVCSVGATQLVRVDLICGGFPCQDVSSAGKRAGLAGARSGLWYEFARIVAEIRPQWVVVENVASGAKAWLDTVCGDLGELGYATLPVPLAAADVGAPHRRERIFVVAHADQGGRHVVAEHAEVAKPPQSANAVQARREGARHHAGERHDGLAAGGWRTPQPDILRVVHGVPRGLDAARPRIQALGNAVVPACSEVIGHVMLSLMRVDR